MIDFIVLVQGEKNDVEHQIGSYSKRFQLEIERMKQSLINRIKKMEQHSSGKVPHGYFVQPSDPDCAWSSREAYERYEAEFTKAFHQYEDEFYKAIDNGDAEGVKLDLNAANIILEKHCVRLRPEKPLPACIQEMLDYDIQELEKRNGIK